jgi:transposase
MYKAPDGDTAHRRLVTFYEWAVEVEVDEVSRLAKTIDTWQDEVLAFFDTRASNAPTESTNVKIKSIRRAALNRPAGLPQLRQLRGPNPPPRRPAT